jgi:hypothetical protein
MLTALQAVHTELRLDDTSCSQEAVASTLLPSVDALTLKKVVLHSAATALASIVLPVPGGPNISTPLSNITMYNTFKHSSMRKQEVSMRSACMS